jgi:uncharacterized repeat protein (TIGR03837 family)
MSAPTQRWDIFCVVVDNYGDVGVAWRLARQLAAEHAVTVRLFVDDLAALAYLVPEVDAGRGEQRVQGVEVRRWDRSRDRCDAVPAEVAIEAFGCGLPTPYLEAMIARKRQPVWINLEYLSAEPWIESCHGLASRHASLPLTRYFFFPGFSGASGGLLRERDLLLRRYRFRADVHAREALWQRLDLAPPSPETLVVSLFCYPNPALPSLFDAWSQGDQPLLCIVPEGVASSTLDAWGRENRLIAGRRLSRGRLTLARVPFMAQDEYDRMLWASDVNFVRGEDSFVRAQWAARPLVWHAYPQTHNAHRLKIQAFLARYCGALVVDAANALLDFELAWNGGGDAGAAWHAFFAARDALEAHAERWAGEQARGVDLTSALVKFCTDRV